MRMIETIQRDRKALQKQLAVLERRLDLVIEEETQAIEALRKAA